MVYGRLNHRSKPIYDATYGLVFFGTPHRGGNHANIGSSFASVVRAVLGRPENSFMHALRKGTFYAEALDRDFREIQENFFVLAFYETQPKPNFGMVRHPISIDLVRRILNDYSLISITCAINKIAVTDN